MLALGVVVGSPAVEGEPTVGTDDVVEVVRAPGVGEETRAGEVFGQRFVAVQFPFGFPVEK